MSSSEIDIQDLEKKIVEVIEENRAGVLFAADSGKFRVRKEWILSDREVNERIMSYMIMTVSRSIECVLLEKIILESGSKQQRAAYADLKERAETIAKLRFDELGDNVARHPKDPATLAVMVLEYLNEQRMKLNPRNSGFKPVPGNLSHIRARIKEKYTFEDFRKVIDLKCRTWNTVKMRSFIRPKTLFSSENFDSYLAEANSSDSFRKTKQDDELEGLMK